MRTRRKINIVAFLVFCALLVWVFRFSDTRTHWIQSVALSLFSPFMKAGNEVQEGVGNAGGAQRSVGQLEEENAALRRELAELRIMRSEFEKTREDFDQVSRMLDLRERSRHSLVASKIIGRDASMWWRTVTVDKGLKAGITTASPVLTDQGLVGKTSHVDAFQSKVILLTDEQCQVSATIEGTTERGLLMGVRGATQGEPVLKLKYLSKDAEVVPGSRVYTYGGGLFPAGLLLGEVREFRALDVYGEAIVRPAVDFASLSYLFIVRQERAKKRSQPVKADTTGAPTNGDTNEVAKAEEG